MGLRTGNNSDWITQFLAIRGVKPKPILPAEVTGLAPSSVLAPIFKAGQTAIANNTTDTSGAKWFDANAPIPQVSKTIPSLAPSAPNSFEQGTYFPPPSSPSLSWNETRNKNEMDALNISVSPMDVQIAKNTAEAAARQKMLDTISSLNLPVRPQYTPPAYTQMPTREQVPYPDRPAPQVDAGGSLLGLLAGAVDPTHAGQYNASPFAAAVTRANEDFENRKNAFAYAVQQADKAYQDAVNSHNAETQHALDVAQANYKNAGAEWQDASDRLHSLTEMARQQGGVDELNLTNANLAPLVAKDSASGVFGLLGKQAGRTIDEGNANNKLQTQLDQAKKKIEAMLTARAMGVDGQQYVADKRAETSTANNQNTNQTRQGIATANNDSRETIAQGHDATRIKTANISAKARSQQIDSDINRLPDDLKMPVQMHGAIEVDMTRQYSIALRSAQKDAAIRPPEQQQGYITNAMAPFAKMLSDAQTKYDAALKAAQTIMTSRRAGGQRPTTPQAPQQNGVIQGNGWSAKKLP